LAGWWSRVGASLIDAVLTGAVTFALLALAGFDFAEYFADDAPLLLTTRPVDLVYAAVGAIVAVAYYVPLMLRWDGRTVGKRVLGIRVVRADGRPLDAGVIVLRQALLQYLLGVVVLLFALVDYLLPLADRQNRALHDFACGTRVVRG